MPAEHNHGGAPSRSHYQRGCRHPACREAANAYQREYRARVESNRPSRTRSRNVAVKVGDRVRHRRLGWGTVLMVDGDRLLVDYHSRRRGCRPLWHAARLAQVILPPHTSVAVYAQTGQSVAKRRQPKNRFKVQTTPEQRDLIRRLRRQGYYYSDIAQRVGVSKSTVARVVRDGLQ